MEKRWRRFVGFFYSLFLIAPILTIGGISTAIFTETREEFELIYHVVFFGTLNFIALISLIGSIYRFRELRKFKGEVVSYSFIKKERTVISKEAVFFHIGGVIFFCSFILLSTGLKLFESIIELVNSNI